MEESSIIGVVDGPVETRWDDGANTGSVMIPTKVRDRKVVIEAPLRKLDLGGGSTLAIGIGANFVDVAQGTCLRATGRLSAQPIRVVVGRVDRLRRADTTRSGLYLQGVLRSYDRFGVGRVELDDGSVIKVELPLGITVGTGERIGARGFPARNANTLRLVDMVLIADPPSISTET